MVKLPTTLGECVISLAGWRDDKRLRGVSWLPTSLFSAQSAGVATDPRRHSAGGNEVGIKEEKILERCETYVVIGNEKVHAGKSIWKRPHVIERPDWLYSRAYNGSPDFIAEFSS